MTDHDTFEARLDAALGRYADRAPTSVDPHAMTQAAMDAIADAGRLGWWRAPFVAAPRPVAILMLLALLLAVLVIAGLGSRLVRPVELSVVPSPTPSAAADATAVTTPVAAALRQPWIADQPAGLSFQGESGARLLSLQFATDGSAASVRVSAVPRLSSAVDAFADGTLRFTTTTGGNPVLSDGATLAGCEPGAVGRYTSSLSADGFLLTLAPVGDECAARAAVVGRTWARSLGDDSLGGRGVVEAFAPRFAVTLPGKTFATSRTSDAIEVWAADETVGLLAWKDPQGFTDPCDAGAGRYEIARGGKAFMDYFRQSSGFTLVSEEPVTVGGYPAIRFVVTVKPEHPCPTGWLVEWQPKAETTDLNWHLNPGDRDIAYVVDHPNATVLLEVLEAPTAVGDGIVSSVQFLDEVPPRP